MNLVSFSSCPSTLLTRTSYPRMLVPAPMHIIHATRGKQAFIVSNSSSSKAIDAPMTSQRRLAQYHPTIWGPNLIDSFTTHYTYESHATKLEGLKQTVAKALVASSTNDDACSILRLIDSMQRLGVAYHFEKEIQEALLTLISSCTLSADLQTIALQFRIRRQYALLENKVIATKL